MCRRSHFRHGIGNKHLMTEQTMRSTRHSVAELCCRLLMTSGSGDGRTHAARQSAVQYNCTCKDRLHDSSLKTRVPAVFEDEGERTIAVMMTR